MSGRATLTIEASTKSRKAKQLSTARTSLPRRLASGVGCSGVSAMFAILRMSWERRGQAAPAGHHYDGSIGGKVTLGWQGPPPPGRRRAEADARGPEESKLMKHRRRGHPRADRKRRPRPDQPLPRSAYPECSLDLTSAALRSDPVSPARRPAAPGSARRSQPCAG